jgi:hypothetical protein
MMQDQLRLVAMQTALVEGYGETCETVWVGGTLVLATVLSGKAHIRLFSREQLLAWYGRAWDYGFTSPDGEFSACVLPTFEPPLELPDQRQAA